MSAPHVDVKPQWQELTRDEARALFDEAARENLNMSGDEFVRKWEAGEIDDPDRPEVMRVYMLLPWAN
jgi:hypothetical protein